MLFQNFFWDKVRIDKADVDHHAALPDVVAYKAIVKDYFLIKINAFGDTEWTQIFGSKNDDLGAAILANQDGSYTIFGTTLFGGLKTLALIKTDNRGRIE